MWSRKAGRRGARVAARIGKRLQAVLELVPTTCSVCDVGAGDGRLALALAAQGRRVIATENKPGALSELRRRLAGAGIEVRRGDGLAPIRQGEVGCGGVAGKGGR